MGKDERGYKRHYLEHGKMYKCYSQSGEGILNCLITRSQEFLMLPVDIRGSGCIRVYCRIKPHFGGQSDAHGAVEFIGEDGSLVNTSKMGKNVQRIFNLNKVFGPSGHL